MRDQTEEMRLYALIRERLFGAAPWPADPETCVALQRLFVELRLREPDTITLLGNADLMLAFLGAWEEFEVPGILERHGLMSADEANELQEEWRGEDNDPRFLALLLPYVQRAFRQYFEAGYSIN